MNDTIDLAINAFPRAGADGKVRACGDSDDMAGSEPEACQEFDGVLTACMDADFERNLKMRVASFTKRHARELAYNEARGIARDTGPQAGAELMTKAAVVTARGELRTARDQNERAPFLAQAQEATAREKA